MNDRRETLTVPGTYGITLHAQRRFVQRKLPVEGIYRAMWHGKIVRQGNRELRYETRYRCGVVVDLSAMVIVTGLRLTKKEIKQMSGKVRG